MPALPHSAMPLLATSVLVLAAAAAASTENDRRFTRSAGVLMDDTSNVIKDFINSVNPMVLVVVGLFIAAGCAFELAYGSRGSAGRTVNHVASRNNVTNMKDFAIA